MWLAAAGQLLFIVWFFFFQAEDGIRDLVRSRGLGDVYKRQLGQGFRLFNRGGADKDRLAVGVRFLDRHHDAVIFLSLIHI